MKNRTKIDSGLLAALLLSLLAVPANASRKAPPDLAGTWILNQDESEDLREKMREARGNGGAGGPGGFGGPGGGGKGGPGGSGDRGSGTFGRGPRERGSSDRSRQMGGFGTGIEKLIIEHNEPLIAVRDASDFEHILTTAPEAGVASGTPESQSLPLYDAKWKGQRLIAERPTSRGGNIKETYEISQTGNQLFVTVALEGNGRMPKIKVRRVYDRQVGQVAAADDG